MKIKSLDLRSVLAGFTYKPNFGFTLYTHEGKQMIKITMVVEDSRAPCSPWVIQPVPRRELRRVSMAFDGDWYEVWKKPENIIGYSPPRAVTEVWGNYTIPYYDEGMTMQFIEWLRLCIRKMENHEIDEWIRYNGELIHDPHKEN